MDRTHQIWVRHLERVKRKLISSILIFCILFTSIIDRKCGRLALPEVSSVFKASKLIKIS